MNESSTVQPSSLHFRLNLGESGFQDNKILVSGGELVLCDETLHLANTHIQHHFAAQFLDATQNFVRDVRHDLSLPPGIPHIPRVRL